MKRIFALLLFLTATPVLWAQNPQTQNQPTFRDDATTSNGVAPGYRPTAGAGLVLNIGAGNAACGSTINYAGGTLTMTASVTNYVYLNVDTSCAPAVKTSAFNANDVQIATVVAGVSTITSIVDDRTTVINQEPNVIPRLVSGTSDALVTGDIGGQVIYQSSSATAVTLADLTAGWYTSFIASGSGGVTVTLTGSHLFVGGTTSTTLVVGQSVGCSITSDSGHYYPHCSTMTVSAGSVTSFNSRTGIVVPTTGDYTCAQVTGCGGFTTTIAASSKALGTSLIASGACASVVTDTATGVVATDNIQADFNADPTSTTGYMAGAMLTIIKYPTTDHVNFIACNNTIAPITPGAVTLNWRVVR